MSIEVKKGGTLVPRGLTDTYFPVGASKDGQQHVPRKTLVEMLGECQANLMWQVSAHVLPKIEISLDSNPDPPK